MKEKMMPLLILTAIVMASFVCYNKWQTQSDELDKMRHVLQLAAPNIKPGSSITFQNEPIKNELHFEARYWLAPNYLAFHAHSYDTVLSIFPLDLKDSMRIVLASANRSILWDYYDNDFSYMLTVKK